MSTFDAGAAVEALAYDFTTVNGADGKPCEGKGTIPEPTRGLLEGAIGRIQKAAGDTGLGDVADADSPSDVLAALNEETIKTLGDEMLGAIADLCQGSPTRAQIEALPVRQQNAFMGWLLGQVGDPTQLNGASRG